jgi:hypothetical protein
MIHIYIAEMNYVNIKGQNAEKRVTHRMVYQACYVSFISGIYHYLFTYLEKLQQKIRPQFSSKKGCRGKTRQNTVLAVF